MVSRSGEGKLDKPFCFNGLRMLYWNCISVPFLVFVWSCGLFKGICSASQSAGTNQNEGNMDSTSAYGRKWKFGPECVLVLCQRCSDAFGADLLPCGMAVGG